MPDVVLRVAAAAKRYGARRALDGVSLDVCAGRVTGLIGANGAGKTTLLRAIIGLLALDGGSIALNRGAAGRGGIGYLPEERGLYPRQTPFRTLRYLATLRGMTDAAAAAAARQWLDRVALPDSESRRLERFSKGQQQKAQLAAAFLGEPPLILLDEPFSGLDPINVRLVGRLVNEVRERGGAVLLSAHQLHLVEELCDDIVMLAEGRVAAAGAVSGFAGGGRRLDDLFEGEAGRGAR